MNQSVGKLEKIGRMLISSTVNFQAYLSPDPYIAPGTEVFEVYERLEKILQNPASNRREFDDIVTVFDFIEMPASTEILVAAVDLGNSFWQVFVLPSEGTDPVPLLKLHLDVGQQPVAVPQVQYKQAPITPTPLTPEAHSPVVKSPNRPAPVASPQRAQVAKDEQTSAVYALASFEIELLLESMYAGEVVVVGRKSQSKYLCKVSVVSRQHFEARKVSDLQFEVRDLGSTNGTYFLSHHGQWVEVQQTVLLDTGTPLRLGVDNDCLNFNLPPSPSYLLSAQAGLAGVLSKMPPGAEVMVGAASKEVDLSFLAGFPDEALLISRRDASNFVLVSYTTLFPIFVQKWGEEEVSRLEGTVTLRAGSTLIFGDVRTGLKVYIPGPMLGQLSDSPAFEKFKIGRAIKALDILDYSAISRNHAEVLRLPDNSVVVIDLHSTNGTFFREGNGSWTKIEKPERVRRGAEVMFGSGTAALCITVPA